MIPFDASLCSDLHFAAEREWLETNGLGGFASSTILGLNTRRYHGLLVAAIKPPATRAVLLSALEEILTIGEQRFELSCDRRAGRLQRDCRLTGFRIDPFPVFTYEVAGLNFQKSVFMVHGQNTSVVQYRIVGESPAGVSLEVRPLIAFRDYHATTHANDSINTRVTSSTGMVSINPYPGLPTLYLAHDGAVLSIDGAWHRHFEYPRERERGLDFEEDLYNFCSLKLTVSRDGAPVSLVASIEPHRVDEAQAFRQAEISRRATLIGAFAGRSAFERHLAAAADQFLVSGRGRHTIIAGYHWFTDWGRDTMIALPGITLATGRHTVARSILLEFSRFVSQGMLPNRFPDDGAPEYNTVDATLWYFEAVRAYMECSGDYDLGARALYPVLTDILQWHLRGTRYGIGVDAADGLLHAGAPGQQLTWMDAKFGDHVVTPRHGKPVEIQALWYNALRIMQDIATRRGDSEISGLCATLAETARDSFNSLFWNEGSGCLYDVISSTGRDSSIRPNQIFAASLPHGMLAPERQRAVVEVVERELLTPFGLRTLSPSDPAYVGRYEGDQRQRDSAYHQGTVWPWLIGPFIRSYLKVHQRSAAAMATVTRWLEAFEPQLLVAGVGQLSEIHDGDFPHFPRGCIAQAWSVAEIFQAQTELSTPPTRGSI